MTALVALAPRSGAIYQQIVEQLQRLIALGSLGPGEQLPTAKQLASDLTVNPNTIIRAYKELERDGLIHSIAGKGTFVSGARASTTARRAVLGATIAALDGCVREARGAGVSDIDLRRAFEQSLRTWYASTRRKMHG
ncbi:MAG TPA: GntR family transcriptional regulator [Gemmatimonadaceae bacterium]